jgi:hypothetical protein|nr:MAG TPA: ReqiPepy6 protein [Caudoviricetes sp.]
MWNSYICDTISGLMITPIDLQSFSWHMSVSDSSLSTNTKRNIGEDGLSQISLPWASVPSNTPEGRNSILYPMKRSIVLMWDDTPVIFGTIGYRVDSEDCTDFSLLSIQDILSSRYLVRENVFGKSYGGTTNDTISYNNMSLRGIAADIIRKCTREKPSGGLPIDTQYDGETGNHQRTYYGYNVSNNAADKLLNEITNVQDGIEMRFVPYKKGNNIRLRFEAGTDSEHELVNSNAKRTLTWFSNGRGLIEELKVSNIGPSMRVYGTGAGQDDSTLCHLAQDLSLCQTRDPWPIVESVVSDTSWDNIDLLRRHSEGTLESSKYPLCQIKGSVHINDFEDQFMGMVWPGDLIDIDIRDHPSLPDGIYTTRILRMEGDSTDKVSLTFSVMRSVSY